MLQEDVLGKCETWYEWLVGKLLYTNPSIRSYDLPYHAEEAITNFGGLGKDSECSFRLMLMEYTSLY